MPDDPLERETSIQAAAAQEVNAIIREAIFEKHLLVTGLYFLCRRKRLTAIAAEAKSSPLEAGARISPFSYSIF